MLKRYRSLLFRRITSLDLPRIYEKKEKRSLVSGLRNQIQSRKKQGDKARTLGNEMISKKTPLQNSEFGQKKKKFAEKHSRSFRRKNSQENHDLKHSFKKSNESFYQKKNQSLVGKDSSSTNFHQSKLSLDKKNPLTVNPEKDDQGNWCLKLKNLDKVSENEEENVKCGSQESRIIRDGSQSLILGDPMEHKDRSLSQENKRTSKNVSLRGGMKRSTGGKLLKMCIYAKKDNKLTLSNEPLSESRPAAPEEAEEDDEGKKFFTLKGKRKEQSPTSKKINEEWKLLYHRRKQQAAQCQSLNTSQKQITLRLPVGLESRPLAESKMIDSKLGGFEEKYYSRPGKMTTSLAVMKHSKNAKVNMGKNYSMFQDRKKRPNNLHTLRTNKHELVKNLYQPEPGKRHGQNHVHEFSWPLNQMNKSREQLRDSGKGKDLRNKRKYNLKNSKKRDTEQSSELDSTDVAFKKPQVKKYRIDKIKRMEQTEVREAVLKDHQHQKANMEKIIRNFHGGRPDKKKKRTSHSKTNMYEAKFAKKLSQIKKQTKGKPEALQSFNTEVMVTESGMNTSMNNNPRGVRDSEPSSSQSGVKHPDKKPKKPRQKKYKTSVQKDSDLSGYSQREIVVPKDFRIFNNKVRSGERFEANREYLKHAKQTRAEHKESFRASQKGVFQGVNEKFKNLQEGIHERMDQKMTQLFNKRTVWRDKLMKNPIAGLKKSGGMRYTKSKKKLFSKPGMKTLMGKMKQSFLNKQKFESDLDKKLTRTNKKGLKDLERQGDGPGKPKKQLSSTQNKTSNNKEKTLIKVKSKMKLDRMLKNRNFIQKGKAKMNLSSQFKMLKKPVGKDNFNKEQELEEDKQKYLANFNIIQYLGKGSYAEVHMAYDKVNDCPVAIKMYERYKLRDEIRSENLENELKILKLLDHKNIIKLYDHIHGERMEFLIMENGPKQMLNDFAKNYHHQRILEYETKIIFQQIIEAVAYLHDEGIVHRDLKMQNILINEKFEIKLIDFGFANFHNNRKKFSVFCGTYSYMAPELVCRIPYDGKATDVWSIGVLLYIMLTGDFPFKGTNQVEMTNNIKNLNYTLPSFLNSDVCDLFRSIFVVDYKKRLSISEIMACDWLLDVGKETDDFKENQSTIFMESTDQMFN